MRLREIMVAPVITIAPDESAEAAWARMEFERVRHLVVTEGNRVLGVLSDRDLGGREGDQVREGRTVGELMTPQVATAKPGTTLRQAANMMSGRLIGCLPVVEDGRLVGIVTATDVLDELGRGSTRPTVRAQRRSMRMPPAGARAANRRKSPPKAEPADEAESGRRQPAVSERATPARGRKRARRAAGTGPTPLPKSIPKPRKRAAGRTGAAETPAYIRSVGGVLDTDDREYLRLKLGRKLGKFASQIERTSVRVEDVNGPRGGIDKRCRIKVVLSGLPSVVIEEQHESLQAAMDGALARVERAVRQAVQRRRAKPLRR